VIVYSSTKAKFQEDILSNDIENVIDNAFRKATGGRVGKQEKLAWKNSLQCMGNVLFDKLKASSRRFNTPASDETASS
jgi:nitric oxide synthase oxygenase domain/subunit